MSDPPEIFHLGQPARDDPAGYVRASSGMIALCGASGVTGALLERSLSTRGRIAAAAGMAGVTAIALAGVRNPRAVSRILVEHPTATMLARLFPLGVTPLLGRRFNAMHMLSQRAGFVCAVREDVSWRGAVGQRVDTGVTRRCS